jgi:hypothetical protein
MTRQEQMNADLIATLQRIESLAGCAPNDDEEKAGEAFTLIMNRARSAIAKAQEASA